MLLFYIPCPNKEEAEKIASELIRTKIAACANIIPGVTSMYEWKGSVHKEQEVILILKCKDSNKQKAEQEITKLHSYECPCILGIKPETTNASFLNWLQITN